MDRLIGSCLLFCLHKIAKTKVTVSYAEENQVVFFNIFTEGDRKSKVIAKYQQPVILRIPFASTLQFG
jgi:hypothetical protein